MSSTASKKVKGRIRESGSVTRHDLATKIATSTELSFRQSSGIVDQIIESITETLAKGEDVLITGFGKFVTMDKKSRQGLNPKTKEPLTIAARRVMKFRPSTLLKDGLMKALSTRQGV